MNYCIAKVIYRGSFGGVATCRCEKPHGHDGNHKTERFYDEDLEVEIEFEWSSKGD